MNHHILWADDDPDFCYYMALVASKIKDLTLTFVSDGSQAVEYLESIALHLDAEGHGLSALITDGRMQTVDGIELIRWVRSHGSLQHLPVLMVSDARAETRAIKAVQAGASAYLFKPMSLADTTDLLESVKAWCTGAPLASRFLIAPAPGVIPLCFWTDHPHRATDHFTRTTAKVGDPGGSRLLAFNTGTQKSRRASRPRFVLKRQEAAATGQRRPRQPQEL